MLTKKQLKYRIKLYRSEKFLKWFRNRYPDKEPHHIIGSLGRLKICDLLCVPVTREQHSKIHNNIEQDFDEMLLQSINILIEYVEYLEKGENT